MNWKVAAAAGAALTLAELTVFAVTTFGAPRFPLGFFEHGRCVECVHREVFRDFYDPYLSAQIEQESNWDPYAKSPAGARGLAQFMPATQRAIERKYGVSGSIWNPKYAAMLQALLMSENLKSCGRVFEGFHNIYACALRIYNGSPRSFWNEWERAGRPAKVADMVGTCVRRWRHCVENWEYPERIRSKRPKYNERLKERAAS